MTKIESKTSEVKSGAEAIFNFLSDMNNIEKLLPPGKYSEWKSDRTSCSFKVQNAYQIGLIYKSAVPFSTIYYESAAGSPFPFILQANIDEKGDRSNCHMVCEADINPFLQMLVKGPLKNLFDYMADQLAVQFPA